MGVLQQCCAAEKDENNVTVGEAPIMQADLKTS